MKILKSSTYNKMLERIAELEDNNSFLSQTIREQKDHIKKGHMNLRCRKFITGEKGSGKTTFLNEVMKNQIKSKYAFLLPHFVHNFESISDRLDYIKRRLKEIFNNGNTLLIDDSYLLTKQEQECLFNFIMLNSINFIIVINESQQLGSGLLKNVQFDTVFGLSRPIQLPLEITQENKVVYISRLDFKLNNL
jgi:Cdc6-like AAA superfamily ATPase